MELYDKTASLQDRTVGTGILSRRTGAPLRRRRLCRPRLRPRLRCAQVDPGYPPYDRLRFDVPVLTEGDVNARVWIRINEIEQSLSLIEQMLHELPPGDVRVAIEPTRSGRRHGAGRGVPRRCAGVAAHRRDGRVDRCHLRDASWFQWPLLEAAIEGNIVADFPLCNKSFNCSYSGHDL